MKEITFTVDDLTPENRVLCKKLAVEQANRIFHGKNRKGRSMEEIIETSMQGMVAEIFLHQVTGWKMSKDNDYDVVDDKGRNVEVKALKNLECKDSNQDARILVARYETGGKRWTKIHRIYFFGYFYDTEKPEFDSEGFPLGKYKIHKKNIHIMKRKFPNTNKRMIGRDPGI